MSCSITLKSARCTCTPAQCHHVHATTAAARPHPTRRANALRRCPRSQTKTGRHKNNRPRSEPSPSIVSASMRPLVRVTMLARWAGASRGPRVASLPPVHRRQHLVSGLRCGSWPFQLHAPQAARRLVHALRGWFEGNQPTLCTLPAQQCKYLPSNRAVAHSTSHWSPSTHPSPSCGDTEAGPRNGDAPTPSRPTAGAVAAGGAGARWGRYASVFRRQTGAKQICASNFAGPRAAGGRPDAPGRGARDGRAAFAGRQVRTEPRVAWEAGRAMRMPAPVLRCPSPPSARGGQRDVVGRPGRRVALPYARPWGRLAGATSFLLPPSLEQRSMAVAGFKAA